MSIKVLGNTGTKNNIYHPNKKSTHQNKSNEQRVKTKTYGKKHSGYTE